MINFLKMTKSYSLEEIEKIKASALLVSKTLATVAEYIKPGVTSLKLDEIAEDFIRSHGGIPSCKGYDGFPYSLCISINEVVVHGFPSKKELQEGDIISVDCVVEKDSYLGDSAYTFAVGEISPEKEALLKTTKESLYIGIEQARLGNRTGDIGAAIQNYCESRSYGIVRELCGHGIGLKMHEKPEVPNFGQKGTGASLKENMVIAIEPMVTMGKRNIILDKDGWSILTRDKMPAAHFEHTVWISKEGPIQLSSFEEIEKIIKAK